MALLGPTGSARIDTLVHDLVETSSEAGDIAQSAELGEAMLELRAFLFAKVYEQRSLADEKARAAFVVHSLFDHLCDHPEHVPPTPDGGDLATRVVDHLAGMTDRFAIRRFQELKVPHAWSEP
jgi:dGTPase